VWNIDRGFIEVQTRRTGTTGVESSCPRLPDVAAADATRRAARREASMEGRA
jgi:hypothetical protein